MAGISSFCLRLVLVAFLVTRNQDLAQGCEVDVDDVEDHCEDLTTEDGGLIALTNTGGTNAIKVGTEADLVCEGGYNFVGNEAVVCQQDKSWKPEPGACEKCPDLMLENGNVEEDVENYGNADATPSQLDWRATFECNAGFELIGASSSLCVTNTWDKPVPTCGACESGWTSVVTCPDPNDQANCYLKCLKAVEGDLDLASAEAACKKQFENAILAEPKNQEEMDAVATQLGALTGDPLALLGINDLTTEGTFVYDSDNAAVPEGVLQWQGGSPTAVGGNDCVFGLVPAGGGDKLLLADGSCDTADSAVCQYKVSGGQ